MKKENKSVSEVIEYLGYYLSCMVLFNFLFLINCLLVANNKINEFSNKSDQIFTNNNLVDLISFITYDTYNLTTLILVIIIFSLGVYFSYFICKKTSSDNFIDSRCKGFEITINSSKNVTLDYYFTNYSLLVLTSISLPCLDSIFTLIIYLILFSSIGLVYIKNNCFAINPLLSLLGYKAFQCEYSCTSFNRENKFKAIFLAKGSDIQKGQKYTVGLLGKSIYRISIFTKQN